MNQRCTNPNLPEYYLWGGRGIKVCDRWKDCFPAFLWDVGEKPDYGVTGHEWSLDRIDSEKDYEPGNVRWTDPVTQSNNRAKWGDRKKEAGITLAWKLARQN